MEEKKGKEISMRKYLEELARRNRLSLRKRITIFPELVKISSPRGRFACHFACSRENRRQFKSSCFLD